jgi:hypothetical protein
MSCEFCQATVVRAPINTGTSARTTFSQVLTRHYVVTCLRLAPTLTHQAKPEQPDAKHCSFHDV